MAHFTPFKKTAIYAMQTLKEVAADRKISIKEIDFDLLQVETLVKSPNHKEWTTIEEPLEKVFSEKLLRSLLLEVRQEYTLKIKPLEKSTVFSNVKLDILTNKTKSKAIAVFKKGSVFGQTAKLAKEIRDEIYRRKLRLGFIVQHYEPELKTNILKLAKYVNPGEPLSKDIKISISKTTEPLLQIDDYVINHYKSQESDDRNLITGVNPDELVFEYVKPQRGKNGRACNGQYVEVLEPLTRNTFYAPDPDTVRTTEDETSIKYYAKRDGYVKNENGVIKISQEIALKEVSFKNTGSINADNNQEISLNITKSHHNNDAVGSGVNIDVQEVHIEGTVGSSASVKAIELSVGEQTHRNSQLEATEHAKVNLHRGKLKAKTAEIEILENGTVEADEITVQKMLGGTIIGKKIFVKELTSNTEVIASDSIEIEKITGENNKLIINPKKIKTFEEEIQRIKEEIKNKELKHKEMQNNYTQEASQHQELLPRVKTFQKRILAATKASKAPNKSDMIRVKQYKRDAEKLQSFLNDLKEMEQEIQETENKLEKLNEAEMHATITHNGSYDGHTQIIFVDVKTDEEHSMVPKGSYQTLRLIRDANEKKITC